MPKTLKVGVVLVGTCVAALLVWLLGFTLLFAVSAQVVVTASGWLWVILGWLGILVLLVGVITWWMVALKSYGGLSKTWRFFFYASLILLTSLSIFYFKEIIWEGFFVDYRENQRVLENTIYETRVLENTVNEIN